MTTDVAIGPVPQQPEGEESRTRFVKTYEGYRLIMADKAPKLVIRPHTKAFFNSIKELSGLSEKGGPARPPTWKPTRKRDTQWDWQKSETLNDLMMKKKADAARLHRVLLERKRGRKQLERKAVAKRRTHRDTIKVGMTDPSIVRALKEKLKTTNAEDNINYETIKRVLKAKPADKSETDRDRLQRLAKPRTVRLMPWLEQFDTTNLPGASSVEIWASRLRCGWFSKKEKKKIQTQIENQKLEHEKPPPPAPRPPPASNRVKKPTIPNACFTESNAVENWISATNEINNKDIPSSQPPPVHQTQTPVRMHRGQNLVELVGVAEFGANEEFRRQERQRVLQRMTPHPPPPIPHQSTSSEDHTSRPTRPRTAPQSRAGSVGAELRKKISTMADKYSLG